MVYVTARHMAGGTGHEHIDSVKWRNPADGATGESTRDQMVTYIEGGGDVRVEGPPDVSVGVVNAYPRKYIRTHADGQWTNNLLSLPTY